MGGQRMNSEQLKKINELIAKLKEIETFLGKQHDGWLLREAVVGADSWIRIDRKVIEPALIAYCDELKRELKELGYED
jgi:hypothetical protein